MIDLDHDVRFFLILGMCLLLLTLLGVWEFVLHRRRLHSIKIRIHVNGTRGKSSVTRLIAAGLRAGGIRTCAETTGTLARMIMPDGREFPVFRPGRTNIIEQRRIIKIAATLDVDALVIECMALHPDLQSLSERQLVCATHAVITNARADHLDVMGPLETDVALALASTVPEKGVFFTAEKRHQDIFAKVAAHKSTTMLSLDEAQLAAVSDTDLSHFAHIEHRDNVALALLVCEYLGVSRAVALQGMQQAEPDPGALVEYRLDYFGRRLHFFNGFAANDPESTLLIWNMALASTAALDKKIVLVNCRLDRADRSRQFAEVISQWPQVDFVVLMGTGTYIFARTAVAHAFSYSRIVFADEQSVDEIFDTILSVAGSSAVIVGIGNIGGQGLDVVQHFKNRSWIGERKP